MRPPTEAIAREVAGRGDQHLAGVATMIREVRQSEQAVEIEHLLEDQLDVAIVDHRVGRGHRGHRRTARVPLRATPARRSVRGDTRAARSMARDRW
ncbi:MAG: hypothetical protein E6J91_52620 [Deltaproteobacteria bacterium]|nr:MAG: hypothetical protein E6J91_52620 [Deltaproteobacteria bacterium]